MLDLLHTATGAPALPALALMPAGASVTASTIHVRGMLRLICKSQVCSISRQHAR
jgi:hypothetical protein